MKTLQTQLVAIFVLFMVSCNDKPSRINEGVITTKQTIFSSIPEVQKQFDSYGNIPITTWFKNGKSRVDIASPIVGKVTTIVDADALKSISLISGPSGKIYTTNEIEKNQIKDLIKNITIEEGVETKNILGFECKQYKVKILQDGSEISLEMFVTDKIEPVFSGEQMILYEKIDGFPMYVTMEMNQFGAELKTVSEVINLEKVEVSDDKFDMTPPEDYKEL